MKRSTLHIVFTNLKKEKEKDWVSINIFESFLEKLDKGKEYVSIKNLIQVDNLDQTFKVFKKGVFDKNIYTLTDISDILELLLKRESLKLERIY